MAEPKFLSDDAFLNASLGTSSPSDNHLTDADFLGIDEAPTFTDAMSRGVDLLQALSYGALEATGEAADAPTLIDIGREGRERNIQEISAAGPRARFTDIDSFGDFTQWAKETIGEQIPIMGPSVAGAALGAGVGAAAGGPPGLAIGAAIGAFVPSAALGTGETQMAIKEIDPEARAPGWAFAGGTAIGTLDSVVPGKLGSAVAKAFGKDAAEEIVRRALEKPVKDNFIKRTAKGAATGMATEGLTEALQEAISEYAAAQATDTELDLEKTREQMIEAGAAGALMGAGAGAVTGAVDRQQQPVVSEVPPAPDVAPPPAEEEAPPTTGGVLPQTDQALRETAEAASQAQSAPAPAPEPATAVSGDVAPPDVAAPVVGEPGDAPAPARATSTPEEIEAARAEVAEPTQAQAEADNYKQGHIKVNGVPVTIETPKGGTRTDKKNDPPLWEVKNFPADYGKILGTTGADGDHLDVFVGPVPMTAGQVFVIDQIDPATGKFDEHKIMVGFANQREAIRVYDKAFTDKSGPSRRGAVQTLPGGLDAIIRWTERADTTQPIAYGKDTTPRAILARRQAEQEAAAQEAADVSRETEPTPAAQPVASWVIREKDTGNVIMETFDQAKVDALNTDKFEAVPVQEHLASLNQPDAPAVAEDLVPEGEVPQKAPTALPDAEARPAGRDEPQDFTVHLPAAKELLGRMKETEGGKTLTIGRLQREIEDLPRATAREVIKALKDEGALTKAGKVPKVRKPSTRPMDLLQTLAGKGLRDDEGHDLAKGRGAKRFIPGRGPLIRKKGMGVDEAGEMLWELGFFGPMETTERPTEAQVLDMLDRALAGEKIYSSLDQGDVAQAEAQAQADQEARDVRDNRGAVDRAVEEFGFELSDSERDEIAAGMAGSGVDAVEAIVEHQERAALEAGAGLGVQSPTEEIPFDGTDQGASEAVERDSGAAPERPRGQEGAAGETPERAPDRQEPADRREGDREPAAEPATEVTPEGEQTLIPGVEPVTDKDRAEAQMAKPLRGGDAPPEGGLFEGGLAPDLFDEGTPAPAERSTYGKKNKVFTEDAADKARELLRKKLSGTTLTSGIDTEIMQAGLTLAGYHVEAGARSFTDFAKAMIADMGEGVRPYLKSWYNALRDYPDFDAAGMTPYDEVAAIDVETIDVSSSDSNLEQPGQGAEPQHVLGEADISDAATSDDERIGGREPEAAAEGDQEPSGPRDLFDDDAAAVGEPGDRGVRAEAPGDGGGVAGDRGRGRGGADRVEGPLDDGRTAETTRKSASSATGLKRKRAEQRAAEKVPLKDQDLDNIRETLPFLRDAQQEDVHFAEQRFAKPDGHGVLFTNGTGTGKTYTGLGIVKRFARQGKENVLIVVPSQDLADVWSNDGKNLGLDISVLGSTTEKGAGITVTTYANFGENRHLAERDWDLVISDESQQLMASKSGEETNALRHFRAVTNHPRGLRNRARMIERDLVDEIDRLNALAKSQRNSDDQRQWAAAETTETRLQEKNAELEEKAKAHIARFREQPRGKAVFLSATPFAYVENVDYAEGYLFEYKEPKERGGYNQPDGHAAFFIEHFGYRMRTGRLTKPEADVNSEVMEREFHEWLRKEGSLSGRILDVDADYDRKFVMVDDAIGNRIDQLMEFLHHAEGGRFQPLARLIGKRFDYLSRRRLLEAMKAHHAVDVIKQHQALGRKVVVFHDYNEGAGFNPFTFAEGELDGRTETFYVDGKPTTVDLGVLYRDFVAKNPDVERMKFAKMRNPIETLTKAFPDALLYNGRVTPKKRIEAKARFNADGSGRDLIIVQSAAGEFGISLHDTTGNHQRVAINLGMPNRPVTTIQEEGRIYRTGQVSDAIFRYFNTGTSWERWAFAGSIAERSSTAENLALGNQARALKDSFIEAFQESDVYPPSAEDGKGGKERDRVDNTLSPFERAKTFYWAQQKKRGRRDQREGIDYFATPEPVGLKMVEFADIKPGEKVLEPSAGHGAIARFFPESAQRTLIEPSSELASRAALASAGAKVLDHRFEDLHINNKYDAIVMNPPYGQGGKTAMDHLVQAMRHLRNGGRIVALLPRGPAADKRFDAWLNNEGQYENAPKGVYLVRNIDMPTVTFERAGTSVATRIVVLEKQTDSDVAQQLQSSGRDYSSIDKINDLFDRIEDAEVQPRLAPKTREVEVNLEGNTVIAGGVEFELRDREADVLLLPKKRLGREVFARVAQLSEDHAGTYDRTERGFIFDTAENRQAFLEGLERGDVPKAATPTGEGVAVGFTKGQTVHGKTGADVFVATPAKRVERDVYLQLKAAAQRHGGHWSSYRGGDAIPGFQFPDAQSRDAFVAEMAGDDDTLYSLVDPTPTFFSSLVRGVEGLKQPKAPAAQWRAMIQKLPGIKAEEIEWSGVVEWLDEQKGSIAREDLVAFLEENQVRVEETTKGRLTDSEIVWTEDVTDDGDRRWTDQHDQLTIVETERDGETVLVLEDRSDLNYQTEWAHLHTAQGVAQARADAQISAHVDEQAQFGQYTLPGGENYRELLLQLPRPTRDQVEPTDSAAAPFMDEWRGLSDEINDLRAEHERLRSRTGVSLEQVNGVLERLGDLESQRDVLHNRMVDATIAENPRMRGVAPFTGGHFQEPNVLAHVRFNERTDAEGQRVLFIEEVQSDWHQRGRREGYRKGPMQLEELEIERLSFDATEYVPFNRLSHNTGPTFDTREEAEQYIADLPERVRRSVEVRPRAAWEADIPSSIVRDHMRTFREENNIPQDAPVIRYRLRGGSGDSWAYNWNPSLSDQDILDMARDNTNRHTSFGQRNLEAKEGIPDAPFKSSWHELAFKRMLRWAAEEGFDRLAWTTGEQQTERYDLSKHISRVDLLRTGEDKYRLFAYGHGDRSGEPVINEIIEGREKIPDYVGKEVADKLFSEENQERMDNDMEARVEGLDLRVGGEGMRGFYDQILPRFANKYAKKWGAKVGVADIAPEPGERFTVEEEFEDGPVVPNLDEPDMSDSVPVHAIDITEAMRESVLAGQPLFAMAPGGPKPIPGDVFGPTDDLRALRERAREFGRANLYGREFTNPDQGITVRVNRRGLGKIFSHGPNPDVILAVAGIEDFIRHGVQQGSEQSDAAGDPTVRYRLFTTSVEIGNQSYDVEFTIRRGEGGVFYYDHDLRLKKGPRRFSGSRANALGDPARQGQASEEADRNIGQRDDDDNLARLADAGPQLSQAQLSEVGQEVTALLKRIAPHLRKVEIVENEVRFRGGRPILAGQYSGLEDLVSITTYGPDPVRAARHEAIHHLRNIGAFTQSEWRRLEEMARKVWMDQYDIENRYGEDYRRRFGEHAEMRMIEEAIADAYSDWQGGTLRPMSAIERIFQKIREFWDAMKQIVGDRGVTETDVFRRVERGQVGRRAPAAVSLSEALRSKDPALIRQAVEGQSFTKRQISQALKAAGLVRLERLYRQAPDELVDDLRQYSLVGTAGQALRRPQQQPQRRRVTGTAAQEAAIEATMEIGAPASLRERAQQLVEQVRETSVLQVKQRVVDQFASIESWEKAVRGQIGDAAMSAYKMARLTQNLQSTMAAVLHHGPLEYADGGFRVMPGFEGGFQGIFEPLAEQGLLHLWKGWAAANRANRLIQEGRESNFTQDQIDALLPLGEQYPEFQAALERWQAFNRAMLDMAEAAGLINAEQREIWEKDDYVPFYRILEDETAGPGTRRGIAGQRSGIRKLRGGEAKVGDLVENMVMNMTHLVDASFKNIATQRVMEMLEDGGLADGDVVSAESLDWKIAHVKPNDAAKKLMEIGVDVDALTPAQKDNWLKLFTMTPPKDPAVVSYMVDGKVVYKRVHDPLLLASLTSLRPEGADFLMTMLRAPKGWLTKGVTSLPGFMMRNMIRDTASAWVVTGERFHFGDTAKGFLKSLREDPSVVAIMAHGGGSGGFYKIEPETVREQIDAKLRGVDQRTIIDSAKKGFEWWRKIGRASENANRIAIYEAVLERGGSEAEAAFQAMNLLDFSMRGDARAVRFLIETVPFLNARLQGLHRLYQGARENPKSFMLRGGAILAATMVLTALNWDDDRYDRLEEWDKDTYYHIFLDNIFGADALKAAGIDASQFHLRIPKPFEVGAIFSTVPERTTRILLGKDKFKTTRKQMLDMVTQTFAFDPFPQAIKPIVEQIANVNFFTDRPIVSQRLETRMPEAQYTPGTSGTARLLGDLTGTSPVRIDHLARAYFGGVGMYVMQITGGLVDIASGRAPKPEWRADRIPEIGGFIRNHPMQGSKYVTEFYEMRKEARALYSTWRDYRRQGRTDAAAALVQDHRPLLRSRKALERVAKRLSKVSDRTRAIYDNETMSPAEKRRQLDQLSALRNQLAERIVRHVDAISR